jgi:cytochrome c-type biogenesis protein CcmF
MGADGWAPLVAFGLGGFAAGAALRQIVLATRRQGWRGLVGRANGGMVVHLGVIMVAVALVASNAYTSTRTVDATLNEPIEVLGHQVELVGVRVDKTAREERSVAEVQIDGGKVLEPAMTTYLQRGEVIPTPGVGSTLRYDLYITVAENDPPAADATVVGLQIQKKPLMMWMWLGGLMMALGTVLAAFPGRRRDPLDPVSAPVGGRGRAVDPTGSDSPEASGSSGPAPEDQPEPALVRQLGAHHA